MFKWIFILFILFLAVWLFGKEYIPENIRYSSAGKSLTAGLFPLEYKIHATSRKAKKYDGQIVEVDESRVNSLFRSLNGVNKKAVIFLYDSRCFFCHYVLNDINNLAKEYARSGNVIFLVVAFEEDRARLNYMLSNLDNIYFRPIITKPQNMKTAANALAKSDIGISTVPVAVLKNNASTQYENLTPDFSLKNTLILKLKN